MNTKPPLIVLTGPTASGKTALSVELAGQLNAEIISADSIQVYRHMDIGSAKVTPDEMKGIKHYLIDELNPDEEFNIYRFKELATKYINRIYSKGKIPMIVGGTGFYIQSIVYDVDFSKTDDSHEYRHELEQLAEKHGAIYLHKMLMDVDKVTADKVHYNNVKRVIRALEYYHDTGMPISEHNAAQQERISPYNFIYFVLTDERSRLYERIDKRVDEMFKSGLVDEVKWLLYNGCTPDMISMQGIGYKEVVSYLNGEMGLDETIELIKKNTRHFAKRQLTWFRREKEVEWIDLSEHGYDKNIMLTKMTECCKMKGITDYEFTGNVQ